MQIVSYNVNGIRAVLNKGFLDWLKDNTFDIICLQEVKASLDQIDKKVFEDLGYHVYWYAAQKKGYSGVAILSKIMPEQVVYGQNNALYDFEGRTLQLHFKDFVLINTYFPSGSSGEDRQEFKYRFLDDYYLFIQTFMKPIIVVGDYNICHQAIDIHNPKGLSTTSGFLPEERAWMDKWFQLDLTDSFRFINPTLKDHYTWWSYRANAKANNKGWRIDYISLSNSLLVRLKAVNILSEVSFSDHCPISIDIDL